MTLRGVPQSLFGRLLLALLVTISVTLMVVTALLVREWREVLVASGRPDVTASSIAAITDVYADLGAAERSAQLAERRSGPISRFYTDVRMISEKDLADAATELEGQLRQVLPQAYAVAVTPPPMPAFMVNQSEQRYFFNQEPPFLDVVVTLPDGEALMFRVEVPRAPPRFPMALVLQLLLVTLVFGAVLYWTARTVTRPLRELETAAEAVGRGARFVPLRESGTRELRNTTRAFNAMQERLNRYLDSRTRVLSAMSHDLRTPLTRLKLRIEALEDERLRARCDADLDEMELLVTGALNMFRGLDDKERLEPVLLEDLVAELRREFAEVGSKVTVAGVTRAPISARRSSLKRCLTNLITNAIKYGERATVTVADDAGDVVVRVLDEGPGIPEDMLEKVFEPFFRLEESRNVDTGGTGLGLSIARDVAQAHGGSLVLRNRSPRGLEATLRLPRSAAS